MNMPTTQPAVSMVYFNSEGKVLAVSRKDDHTKFGFPGGKVDPGETLLEAVYREMEEETGARPLTAPARIYEALCPNDKYPASGPEAYLCTAFLVYIDEQDVVRQPAPDEGITAWLDPEEIYAGPFGDYNRAVVERVEAIFGKMRDLE